MGLLDRGNQLVTVYPEETVFDADGNLITRASSTGVVVKAVVQPVAASGTSGRRAEQDNEGFESEANYRLRISRRENVTLGAQSKILWDGKVFSVVGDATQYDGSRETRHRDYSLRRN